MYSMLFYGWISKKNNLVKYRSNEHDDNFEKKKKKIIVQQWLNLENEDDNS